MAGHRKPFRVLHVVDSLAVGGMENGIVNVSRILATRGFEIHAACLTRRGEFSERMPQPDLVRSLKKPAGFSPAATLRLALLLRNVRPAIVHSHNLGPLIYSGLASLRGRTAVIVHGEHSHLTREEQTPRRLKQRRTFYRACRAIHTVSEGMLQDLRNVALANGRMRAIRNGVDTNRFVPGSKVHARRALGLPEEAEIIGIVARFGEHKGHRRLLDAFEMVAASKPRLHLLVAGSGGPEEASVRARVAVSSFASRIHLTGFVAKPEVCYQALDLLVIPSSNEGLSNAALEAMACGTPVLGNIGCSHEEIMDHEVNGWITELDSPDAIAKAIEDRIAGPQQMIEFGHRARQKVEDNFSLTTMADAYESLYFAASSRTPV